MPPKSRPLMQFRENRLATFEGTYQQGSKQKRYWIYDVPDKEQLADFGFFYTPTKKYNDQITCFFCSKKESNVEGVENIAEHHLNNHPRCPYSLIISHQVEHLSAEENEYWAKQDPLFSDPLSRKSCELRKKTFGLYWQLDETKSAKTTSETLAKAGFYYCPLNEHNDRVQCVYCHCPLDTWDPQDDPMTEHLNNGASDCYFILQHNNRPNGKTRSRSLTPKSASVIRQDVSVAGSKDASRTNSTSDHELFSDAAVENNLNTDIEARIPSDLIAKSKPVTKESIMNIKIRHGKQASRENHTTRSKLIKSTKESAHNPVDDLEQFIQEVEILSDFDREELTDNEYRSESQAVSQSESEQNNSISRRTRSSQKQLRSTVIESNDDSKLIDGLNELQPSRKRRASRSKKTSLATRKRRKLSPKAESIQNSDEQVDEIESDNGGVSIFESKQPLEAVQTNIQSNPKSGPKFKHLEKVEQAHDKNESSIQVTSIPKKASELRRALVENTVSLEEAGTSLNELLDDIQGDDDIEYREVTEESIFDEDVANTQDSEYANDIPHLSETKRRKNARSKKPVSKKDDKVPDKKRSKLKLEQDKINKSEESFDEERFAEVLKAPRNSKKIKLAKAKKIPTAPLFDISDQNIGDYDEKNLNYLESNVQKATFVGTAKAPPKQKVSKTHVIDTSTESIHNSTKIPKDFENMTTSTPTKRNMSPANLKNEDVEKSPLPQGEKTKADNDEDLADDEAEEPEEEVEVGSSLLAQKQRSSMTPVRDLLPSDVSVSTDIGLDFGRSPTHGRTKEPSPAKDDVIDEPTSEPDVAIDASLPIQEFGDDIKYIMHLNHELEESLKELSDDKEDSNEEYVNENENLLESSKSYENNETTRQRLTEEERPDKEEPAKPDRPQSSLEPTPLHKHADVEIGLEQQVKEVSEHRMSLTKSSFRASLGQREREEVGEDEAVVKDNVSIEMTQEKQERTGVEAEIKAETEEGLNQVKVQSKELNEGQDEFKVEQNAADVESKPTNTEASVNPGPSVSISPNRLPVLDKGEEKMSRLSPKTDVQEDKQNESSIHISLHRKSLPPIDVEAQKEIILWDEAKFSVIEDKLQNMQNACKYLEDISKSSYSLRDDIDGQLTHFISTMPEEEEDMTIKQWIEHSAANCRKLVREMCQEMIQLYKSQQEKALKLLESLPTVD